MPMFMRRSRRDFLMQQNTDYPRKKGTRTVNRSSTACVACRKRKSKCDGNPNDPNTRCSVCQRLNIECGFVLNDARKWPSSKSYVQALQGRISKLEEKLRSYEGEYCGPHSSTPRTVAPRSPSHLVSEYSPSPAPSRNVLHEVAGSPVENPSIPLGEQPLSTGLPRKSDLDCVAESPAPASGVFKRPAEGDTAKSNREDVFKKFNGWAGHLKMDADGLTRYYGVTSDHHTAFEPDTASESTPTETSSSFSSELSGYGCFQDYLLELFWQYPHSFLRIYDRELFMEGVRKGRKTHYFSPFLLNCIILRSLPLTDNPLVKRLEPALFDRAKQHLFTELERPDHNTVLGLLFLSACLSGQLKSGLGWTYIGIACRLVFALGLHQDLTPLLKTGEVTRRELEYRQMIFWGAFVNDSLWSVSFGRPSCIRLHDISCPPISPLHTSPDMALLAAWAALCQVQVNITDLYNGPRYKLYTEDMIQFVSELDQTLSRWHSELSDDLSFSHNQDAGKPPAVYVLHMTYLACLIVLYRPLVAFEGNRSCLTWPELPNGRGRHDGVSSICRNKCRSAALEMSQVLKAYIDRFVPKQFPIIFGRMSFIAATTLIFDILTAGKGHHEELVEDRDSLKTCIYILDLMEDHFPSLKYTKGVLLKIMNRNAIFLDENGLGQTSNPINSHDGTWMDYASLPTIDWTTDLDWFLSASSSEGPLRGLGQDSGTDGNDPSFLNLGVDQILSGVDFPGITPSAFSMQHSLPSQEFGGFT